MPDPIPAIDAKPNPWAVMILTFKGVGTVLYDGGIQSFPVNRDRVRRLEYCVVVRNQHNQHHAAEDNKPHGTAFIIGRIKEVGPSREPGVLAEEAKPGFKGRKRSLITFSEYALIDEHEVWQEHGARFSAQYRPLADIGIDLSKLDWKPMPSNMEKAASGADPTLPYDHEFDEGKDTEELPPLDPEFAKLAAEAHQTVKDGRDANLPDPVAASQPAEISLGSYAHFIQQAKAEAAAALAARIGVAPESIYIEVRL